MDKMKVAAISIENCINDKARSVAKMREWTARAKELGAELVLFPELNVSGYVTADIVKEISETVPGPSTEQITEIARQHQLLVSFGILEREADIVFCSHVLVDGNGIIGKQRKIHPPAHERPFWASGSEISVFDTKKARIGISICRDSFFDEYTRTLYFKGAEVVLMPLTYAHPAPRKEWVTGTIHGMSIVKAGWSNGYFTVFCNSAGCRQPNQWESCETKFTGFAGVTSPWGDVVCNVNTEGNDEEMVVVELDPAILIDRRKHPNFLAEELKPNLYKFMH